MSEEVDSIKDRTDEMELETHFIKIYLITCAPKGLGSDCASVHSTQGLCSSLYTDSSVRGYKCR